MHNALLTEWQIPLAQDAPRNCGHDPEAKRLVISRSLAQRDEGLAALALHYPLSSTRPGLVDNRQDQH